MRNKIKIVITHAVNARKIKIIKNVQNASLNSEFKQKTNAFVE